MIDPVTGAALISGAAGLLGGSSRNKAAQRAAANQMAFQREMSNTSYQRGMTDMKKAGLNPILAGKMGGASTPGGATYQPENVGMAGQQAFANIQNTMAQTAKIKAETGVLKKSEGSFLGKTIEYGKSQFKKAVNSGTSTIKQLIDFYDQLPRYETGGTAKIGQGGKILKHKKGYHTYKDETGKWRQYKLE